MGGSWGVVQEVLGLWDNAKHGDWTLKRASWGVAARCAERARAPLRAVCRRPQRRVRGEGRCRCRCADALQLLLVMRRTCPLTPSSVPRPAAQGRPRHLSDHRGQPHIGRACSVGRPGGAHRRAAAPQPEALHHQVSAAALFLCAACHVSQPMDVGLSEGCSRCRPPGGAAAAGSRHGWWRRQGSADLAVRGGHRPGERRRKVCACTRALPEPLKVHQGLCAVCLPARATPRSTLVPPLHHRPAGGTTTTLLWARR